MRTALQMAEERYRRIVEMAKEGVWHIDADDRTTFASNKFASMLGYAPEEMVNRPVSALVAPSERTPVLAALALLRDNVSLQRELSFQRKDGTSVKTRISASPFLNGGNYAGALVMVTRLGDAAALSHECGDQGLATGGPSRNRGTMDRLPEALFQEIPELGASSEAPVDTQARITSILESIQDTFFALDRNWRFTYINAAGERRYGRTREYLLGRNIWEEFPRVAGTVFHEQYEKTMRERAAVVFEAHYEPLDRWLEVRVFPVDTGIAVYLRDTTDAKQAQRAAEESERFARSTVDALSAHIAILDENGAILAVNRAWRDFASENDAAANRACHEGANYLRICEQAQGEEDQETRDFARGIRRVMNGEIEEYSLEYPCHSPYQQRWFIGRVTRFPGDGPVRIVVAHENITARKLAEETVQHQAQYDALTGLPNRVLFHDRLEQALGSALRHQKEAAILFLDLDGFKHVNDTLGHAVGDHLLATVALRIKGCLRAEDTVARMGGDEFTVLIPCVEQPEDAASVARKLLKALEAPISLEGRDLYISGSVGISFFPFDGRDAQTLLRNADTAMYRAKEQGRNNFQFYTEAMNATAFERLFLESSMRKALEQGEFTLYYQPQVDLRTGDVMGVEALIRWQHPELGMIPPATFIPVAEETGMILRIGEWVLKEACLQAARWQREGHYLRVSVNLSPRQFSHQCLSEMVAATLAETNLQSEWLDLELTESTLVKNKEVVVETLARLKSLGVRLSVDDFGTGYSSLSRLRYFPLDVLKIDRSFVADMLHDTGGEAMVKAIIDLAHALSLDVIAEGIETDEQRERLTLLGCDAMQGYLFSPPVPAETLEALLHFDGRPALLP